MGRVTRSTRSSSRASFSTILEESNPSSMFEGSMTSSKVNEGEEGTTPSLEISKEKDSPDVDTEEDVKELIKCIMIYDIAAEYSINDSCKDNQIYKVYELRF